MTGLEACFLPSSEANAGAGVGRGREGKDGKISRYLPRWICYNIPVGQRFRVFGEHDMSKDFAIKVLDSMTDENGHCGERGLSKKQFDVISEAMDLTDRTEYDSGEWEGDYATIGFWSIEYTGNVGPYRVTVEEHKHFNKGYCLLGIDLRPEGEYEAELEEERRLAELRDFSHSEWVAEPKKRLALNLTLVDVYEFEGYSYSYYDDGMTYLYKFRDEDGNCIVWKTKKCMWEWKHDDVWDVIETSARVTVKEHSEYRGIKQTIINRPAFKEVAA